MRWKAVRFVLVVVLILLVAGTLVSFWRASQQRSDDEQFHSGLARTMTLASDSLQASGAWTNAITCHGGGQSPQLHWDHAPTGTQSYALLADDWDAPSPALRLGHFSHWVLFNVAPTIDHIEAGIRAGELEHEGIAIGLNSLEEAAFVPPCPPLGTHRYVFRIYALDQASLHPAVANRDGLLAAIQGHILAYGELDGLSSAN